MTPREVVLHAIEFRDPPRVPVNYCNRDLECSDVLAFGAGCARGWQPSVPGESEWGFVWHSLDETMGQPDHWPITCEADLNSYVPPDPWAPGRFEHLPALIEQHRDKFLRFSVGISGFNQATFLRGFEDFLVDLYANRPFAERVLDLVFDFENGLIEQACDYDFDCVCFGDDWGTQRGLIIQPDLWREVFKPRYAAQFARIHEAGKKVWFHCCGNVWDVIGDFIEAGVDVLELLQPDVFGVERLGETFGGQVTFCCAVDHQRLACTGTREELLAYAERLNANLGCFGGGFIGYVEDYHSLAMPEENYQTLREAFARLVPPPRSR